MVTAITHCHLCQYEFTNEAFFDQVCNEFVTFAVTIIVTILRIPVVYIEYIALIELTIYYCIEAKLCSSTIFKKQSVLLFFL